MSNEIFLVLCGLGVLASALVSGVFLAFSDFVMKSLGTLPAPAGIEAMQVINRDVYGSIFLTLLMGVAPLTIVLAALAWFRLDGAATALIVTASLVYVVGVMFVTIKFNVPMNQQLDVLDQQSAEAAAYWATYLSKWTGWNHWRTVASATSAVCLLAGCILIGKEIAS